MFRVLRIPLYPTPIQRNTLASHLEICRTLYNAAVEERVRAGQHGIRLGRYDQQVQLPGIRRALPEYKQVSSIVMQQVTQRVHLAFQRHHKRITGAPNFKKRGAYVSLSYSAHRRGNYLWHGNRIEFAKIGSIKCRFSGRPPWFPKSRPKACTIKRVGARWFCYIRFEIADAGRPNAPLSVIGLDVGLESFAVTSDGLSIPNLRSYSRREKRIARLQRRYDRRKLGGKNREKAHGQVARLFEKSREERLNLHHQWSRRLARSHAFVAVEKNITGLRNGMLRKSVYDVGWGQFLRLLEYKLAEHGGMLMRVPAAYTSQRCSACGTIVRKSLSTRHHQCRTCGFEATRDHNAAINIRQLAERQLPREPGKVTPAEIGSHRASGPVPVKEAGTSVE